MSQYIIVRETHKHIKKHSQYWVGLGLGVPLLLVLGYVLKTYLLPVSFKDAPTSTPIASEVAQPPAASLPKTPEQIQTEQLQSLVTAYTASEQANFYIYIHNLTNGVALSLNDTTSVPSGSIYKLFVAHEAYRRNEAGEFSFAALAGGTGYTVGHCVVLMVRNSTNVCGEAVRAMLGGGRLDQDLHAQGYTGVDFTSHEAAHVSAHDIGLLYERLLVGTTLNEAHRAEFIQSLKDQQWTFRIPTGLPHASIPKGQLDWGNKTGDVYDYANDSAIVWGQNATYILVLLSNGWPNVFPYSSYSIRHFSGQLYNLFNGTDYPLPY